MPRVGREFYLANEAYARALDAIEPDAYSLYVDRLARAGRGKAILDVGCGTGTAVQLLRARGCDARGCDLSPAFIARARDKAGTSFDVIGGDGCLPYDSAAFTAVGSFNVLEHTETPSSFLDEVTRVLAPEGTLVLACPNMLSISWPRPREGIRNPWRIRLLNAFLLASRALGVGKAGSEFLTVECTLEMADYEADYDAVCLTNYFDVRRALRMRGLRLTSFTGTERVHAGAFGRIADALFASPLGALLGAVFVTAVKDR